MKSTLELARKLEMIEKVFVNKSDSLYSHQNFQYLLVLDFESTCWDRTTNFTIKPEIIEFSVVLYKISTFKIIAEFQQYVMPTENYKLSEFCINFTGIQQKQVENGVPIGTCLILFSKWLQQQEQQHKIVLYKNDNTLKSNCIFVTWSDWDLGNCLYNECKRKMVKKEKYFKNWADLRALYKEYYNRKPQGLNGALNEVGLKFIGKEHCGLDDARNTAFLAGKMIQDGVLIRITKELDSV